MHRERSRCAFDTRITSRQYYADRLSASQRSLTCFCLTFHALTSRPYFYQIGHPYYVNIFGSPMQSLCLQKSDWLKSNRPNIDQQMTHNHLKTHYLSSSIPPNKCSSDSMFVTVCMLIKAKFRSWALTCGNIRFLTLSYYYSFVWRF